MFSTDISYSISVVGRWCPPNNPIPKVFPHAASNANYDFRLRERDLKDKEAKMKQKELHLQQLETKLVLKYPDLAHMIRMNQLDKIPTIYAITPTYARAVQKAELTRLAQTFLHIVNFHWIVVEDSFEKTNLVSTFLAKSGLKYIHLNIGTPPSYKMADVDPNWLKPRGVLQRNKALEWIRENINVDTDKGVVYFADDDNTYDLRLFDEVNNTHCPLPHNTIHSSALSILNPIDLQSHNKLFIS